MHWEDTQEACDKETIPNPGLGLAMACGSPEGLVTPRETLLLGPLLSGRTGKGGLSCPQAAPELPAPPQLDPDITSDSSVQIKGHVQSDNLIGQI